MSDPVIIVHPHVAARIVMDAREIATRLTLTAKHMKDVLATKPISELHAAALADTVKNKKNQLERLAEQLKESQAAVATLSASDLAAANTLADKMTPAAPAAPAVPAAPAKV